MFLNWLLRWFVLGLPVRLLFPADITGEAALPKGPFVLACGPHKTARETFVVPASLYHHGFNILAKDSIWKVPGLGPVVSAAGLIPVNRRDPGAGNTALQEATRRLNKGKKVLMFPEGKRRLTDPFVYVGKTGAVNMALQADAWLVPLGMIGMARGVFKRRRLVIGEAYRPLTMLSEAERAALNAGQLDVRVLRRLTDDLMRRIAALAQAEYVG
jgi:1-acyl-sn-glycerol-3-phosphate acyltransferase